MEALTMLVTSKSHDNVETRVKASIRAFYGIEAAGLYNSRLSPGITYFENLSFSLCWHAFQCLSISKTSLQNFITLI